MFNHTLKLNPFDPSGFVLVESHVLQKIGSYRQIEKNLPEAGGILLGYRRGHHLHITDLSVPGPKDRQSRTAFHRSESDHQLIAMRHWNESQGTMDYLGEWHTHPEQMPSPSVVDIREWQKILSRGNREMIFIIAGIGSDDWYGVGRTNDLAEMFAIGLQDVI